MEKDDTIQIFKKRLKEIRVRDEMSQTNFAKEILGDRERGRVSSWESTANKTVPQLDTFAILCKETGVSADYLLGLNQSIDDFSIAEAVKLSVDSVKTLKENASVNKLIDFIAAYPEIDNIMVKLDKIWAHKCIIEASQTLFTHNIVEKADKLFREYRDEEGIWDISIGGFEERLINTLKQEKFIDNPELINYMVNLYPEFEKLDLPEQNKLKIHQLAEMRFTYLIKEEQYDILNAEIVEDFRLLLKEYLDERARMFLNRRESKV